MMQHCIEHQQPERKIYRVTEVRWKPDSRYGVTLLMVTKGFGIVVTDGFRVLVTFDLNYTLELW